MKKIAFAVVLCASASFSPVNAQSTAPVTGTFKTIGPTTEYSMVVSVGGAPRVSKVLSVKLNGTELLGLRGLDPDAANKLLGATCTFSGYTNNITATCIK